MMLRWKVYIGQMAITMKPLTQLQLKLLAVSNAMVLR